MKRLVLVLVVFAVAGSFLVIQPTTATAKANADMSCSWNSFRQNFWWGYKVYLNHCDVQKMLYYWDMASFYNWVPDPYGLVADQLWFNRIKDADYGSGVILYFSWAAYFPYKVENN